MSGTTGESSDELGLQVLYGTCRDLLRSKVFPSKGETAANQVALARAPDAAVNSYRLTLASVGVPLDDALPLVGLDVVSCPSELVALPEAK